MLKLLGWLIKSAIFALIVLVLGNYVRWNGRTVSDQVRVGIAQAERSKVANEIRHLGVPVPVSPYATLRTSSAAPVRQPGSTAVTQKKGAPQEDDSPSADEISSSERQKLKDLIRELNRSTDSGHKKN